ncbi:helix-turn-helix domain-containing protein [Azotobacter beijerinckii]|uniref:helix-turn-helix domain-containing protein n=1 Tax=Azotobacter beijerinckii TaxID=170623 RepID=UPI000B809F91|nr:helix-turn-helix domain-containing protein [Azotobacter beijerinckii]
MLKTSAEAVLERLACVLETKSSSQLANALGYSPQAVSGWKTRDTVPYAKCVEIASQHGISLDWLLTGEGQMRRADADATPVQQASTSSEISPREQAILELFRSLGEDDQREIQDAAAEKKRLTAIEQRLEELAAAVADIKRPA